MPQSLAHGAPPLSLEDFDLLAVLGRGAYGRVLAEGLWGELQGSGVDVLAVAPGVTRTPALMADDPQLSGLFERTLSSPEEVAAAALASLGEGPTLVPGRLNRAVDLLLSRLLPRRLAIRILKQNLERLYPSRF